MIAPPLWVNICAAGLLIYSGYHTYALKQQSAFERKQVIQLENDIKLEAERIGILQAEWAYLNNPERLEKLVRDRAPQLGLQPVAPQQLTTLSELPIRAPTTTSVSVHEAVTTAPKGGRTAVP